MNRLSEDEQEAALRCIMLVEQGCGQVTETLPSGKTAFAFRQRPDRIGWGVNKRRPVPLQSRARP
jgi:hypothetical protein